MCRSRDKPQSNLFVPLESMRLTRCNLCVVIFGALAMTALQLSIRNASSAWTSLAADSVSSERRGQKH